MTATAPTAGYRHEALLYDGWDDFVTQLSSFVRGGLAAEEAVMVAVPDPRLALLRSALGPDAATVEFVDMAEAGRNPARLIGLWQQFVQDAGGRPVRGVGEPVFVEREPAALEECLHHEALLNVAFPATTPLWLVCPYDVAGLDAKTVQGALARHPHVCRDGAHEVSHAFDPQAGVAAALSDRLPAPPEDADPTGFGADDLVKVRQLVASRLRREGVPRERAWEFVLAVHEVATNSVRHGGGGGTVSIWRDGDRMTCEVRDRGRLEDALVGRRLPGTRLRGGRGVWLAHQLSDLVQLRSGADGTVVRMHLALERPTTRGATSTRVPDAARPA